MKISLILLATLICAGCSLPSALRPPAAETSRQAQQLFLKGLDELAATGSSPSFKTLHHRYPHDPWTARAGQVSALQAAPAARLRKLRKARQQCSRDKARLEDEVKHLRDDLDKLKQLLIEMERRAN